MSALPAEDDLVGNSQAKESSLGVPGRSVGRRRVAKAEKKRWALTVPDFCLSLPLSALILVRAAEDCCGEREGGGGGP